MRAYVQSQQQEEQEKNYPKNSWVNADLSEAYSGSVSEYER